MNYSGTFMGSVIYNLKPYFWGLDGANMYEKGNHLMDFFEMSERSHGKLII